jgi:hypothetical protein
MARRRIQEWSGPRRIGRRIDPAAISSSAGIRRHEAPECRQAVHAAGLSRLYAVYKNYLVRPKCSHRARPILDVPEQCCGVCLPSPTSTGPASCSLASIISRSAIARRHCRRLRLRSISGPLCGAKEFPVATIRARAILRPEPAMPSRWPLAYRLRKLRELQDPGSGRPAPGLEIGITLAETAETPAMGRPARYRDRIEGRAERAERSETHSDPIAVRKYSWGRHWETPARRSLSRGFARFANGERRMSRHAFDAGVGRI